MMNLFAELRRRNVLRVAGTFLVGSWFLVQIAFTLESVMQLPEWFDAMFMALMILGLPVAIILAWAFELTPEGFKRTEAVSEEESISAKTGRTLDWAILGGLVLIGGLVVWGELRPSTTHAKLTTVKGNSIAVLPFENRSADVTNAYFADGIHDELLNSLSRVVGLDVISRTSVMGYRNTEKRVPEIAAELGAAAILEGAVQKAGERVRITVQLIDGRDDTHIWANNYDRALTTENIFDIQGEITRVIADSLEDVLTGNIPTDNTGRPTDNMAAFDAYIQAKLKTDPGNPDKEDLIQALAGYERAVTLDPNFGQSWAKKAYAQLALYWFHSKDPADRAAAKISLDRARALAPNMLETHLADAFYHYWSFESPNFREAEEAFDRALSVAPSDVDAIAGKAFMARRLGDFDTALKGLEYAHRIDPLSFYLVPELALTYALVGDEDKAKAYVEKARAMDSTSLQGAAFAAAIAQFRGDADAAYVLFSPVGEILPNALFDYAMTTRNEAYIKESLERWPAEHKESEAGKVQYAIAKMYYANFLGTDTDKAAAKSALKEFAVSSPQWDRAADIDPVTIPAMLGQADIVARLANSYDAYNPDDKMQAITDYGSIIQGFAMLGDADNAMKFIEKMEALTGPHVIFVLQSDPALDGIRNHPGYQALKKRAMAK